MPRFRSHNIIGGASFPSSTAGEGTPLGDTSEEVFYRCQQCGMLCLADQVQSPGGANEGNGGIIVQVTSSVGDPINQSGYCPFCGSANSRRT